MVSTNRALDQPQRTRRLLVFLLLCCDRQLRSSRLTMNKCRCFAMERSVTIRLMSKPEVRFPKPFKSTFPLSLFLSRSRILSR
ncbi:hypothetical protein BKA65DRAFT_91579 [Rhexocercosporidium sp. MPI-PUGE-AT-0058]|nr:hypothetical protein BKA65DRAFT_91579 [Rhexocercosporidium sp. MPI-PUGE-AT-0058]